MNDIIKAVAKEIANESFLHNWKFYAILLAVSFVASAFSSLFTEYFKTRGKMRATKADFDEIIRQLKKTTETTEEIKSDLGHLQWQLREKNTLMRQKLEELLNCVYDVQNWLDKQRDALLFDDDKVKDLSPIHKIKMLATLYFPELLQHIYPLVVTEVKTRAWICKCVQEKLNNKKAGNTDLISKDTLSEYEPIYSELLKASDAILNNAKEVMESLLASPNNGVVADAANNASPHTP